MQIMQVGYNICSTTTTTTNNTNTHSTASKHHTILNTSCFLLPPLPSSPSSSHSHIILMHCSVFSPTTFRSVSHGVLGLFVQRSSFSLKLPDYDGQTMRTIRHGYIGPGGTYQSLWLGGGIGNDGMDHKKYSNSVIDLQRRQGMGQGLKRSMASASGWSGRNNRERNSFGRTESRAGRGGRARGGGAQPREVRGIGGPPKGGAPARVGSKQGTNRYYNDRTDNNEQGWRSSNGDDWKQPTSNEGVSRKNQRSDDADEWSPVRGATDYGDDTANDDDDQWRRDRRPMNRSSSSSSYSSSRYQQDRRNRFQDAPAAPRRRSLKQESGFSFDDYDMIDTERYSNDDNDDGTGRDGDQQLSYDEEDDYYAQRSSPRQFDRYNRAFYDRDDPDRPLSEIQIALRSGHDFVYGVSPVLAALKAQRRDNYYTLYLQEGMTMKEKKDKAATAEIERIAKTLEIPIKRLDKGRLNSLTQSRPHQGFVLESDHLEFVDLKALDPYVAPGTNSNIRQDPPSDLSDSSETTHDNRLKDSTNHDPSTSPSKIMRAPCWLALDELWDPQNFGALLRTAYFLGVDGVVTCAKNSAKLTPIVSKASSGAMEILPVYSVKIMPTFLKASQDNGWRVLGAAITNDAVDCKSITLDVPTIVVLGNEGHGLRTNVLRTCNLFIRISGHNKKSDNMYVDSLNVSVAGGVILHQLLGK